MIKKDTLIRALELDSKHKGNEVAPKQASSHLLIHTNKVGGQQNDHWRLVYIPQIIYNQVKVK